jgi:hypothetical protein
MIKELLKYEIYSNWLFVWFIFYYIGLIKASPLLFLIIGLITLIYGLISSGKINKNIIKVIKINFFIKVIPIFLIFKFPLFTEEDLLFGFFVLYFYIITLLYFNKNPIDIYIKINLKNL